MLRAKSFKVESKRSDKRASPMTSIELSQYVGGELNEAYPDVKVDVHEPELIVHIEVRDLAAYVHGAPVPGAGGMPVGCNGTAVTLLSGGIDSPVSSYMIAKRGVHLIPVHFFFPTPHSRPRKKVIELAQIITAYCGKMTMEIVPFTHIQGGDTRQVPGGVLHADNAPVHDAHRTARIALDNNARAIVTGENLGQVANQTMEAMASTQAVLQLPVLQPLIGMDKEEIVRLARKNRHV